MIPKELKTRLRAGEPLVQEFSAFMNATFRYYSETRALFFDQLPAHLHQSELVSFVNVELKNRLFNQPFCESIQESLKALRRIIIRLEDLRRERPGAPAQLPARPEGLIPLAERVEALYQRHWEHFRYQSRLNEDELVRFLLEIDEVGRAWERLLEGHKSTAALVESLSGRACPEGMTPLVVTYQREGAGHFATSTLRALMDFFEAGYGFVCGVCEVDGSAVPLTLLHVEVGEPVEVHLAVAAEAEAPFRKLLQYLFLQDMLRRENLLKFVFEAIQKDYGKGKTLNGPAMTAAQKALAGPLKQLPPDGRFTISNRTFPDDGIEVLRELTVYLEEKKVNFDGLLRPPEKGGAKAKPATPPAKPDTDPPAPDPRDVPLIPPEAKEKEHIRILTEGGG